MKARDRQVTLLGMDVMAIEPSLFGSLLGPSTTVTCAQPLKTCVRTKHIIHNQENWLHLDTQETHGMILQIHT